MVERDPGVSLQNLLREALLSILGDADARAQVHHLAFHHEDPLQQVHQPPGDAA